MTVKNMITVFPPWMFLVILHEVLCATSSTFTTTDPSHGTVGLSTNLSSTGRPENSPLNTTPSRPEGPSVCLPGFQCVHGFCVTGLSCQCDDGWTGILCSDPEPASPSQSTSSLTKTENDSRRAGGGGVGGTGDEGMTEEGEECLLGVKCVHGVCRQGEIGCDCRQGWTGGFCHILDTPPYYGSTNDSSKQHPPTTANNSNENITRPMLNLWKPLPGHGPLADLSLRSCTAGFQCRYGNCSSGQPYFCLCEPEFHGLLCEKPCSVPCGLHAQCTYAGCECHQNYTGENCSELRPWDDEVEQRSYVHIVAVCVSVVIVMMMVLAVVFYLLWRRGNITMLKLVFWFQGAEEDDGRQYDAFVSYASTQEDRQFVLGTLMPVLENEMEFTLCIHERDFMPGKYITSNIMDSVRQSRRTLLVISPAFVGRNWCKFEFQAAVAEMIEQKHRILPVIFGDLKEIKQGYTKYKTFQQVMEMVTYLQYPGNSASDQELQRFWKRLELSMPKKMKRTTPPSSPSSPTSCQPSLRQHHLVQQGPKGTDSPSSGISNKTDPHSITLQPNSNLNHTDCETTNTPTPSLRSGEGSFLSMFRKEIARVKKPLKRSNKSQSYSINYSKNLDHSENIMETIDKESRDSNSSAHPQPPKDDTSSNDNSLTQFEKGENKQLQILSDWTWPTDILLDSPTDVQQIC